MAASRIPNPLGQGSSPWGYASFRMLTANLYTELLIQLVKIHPVYFVPRWCNGNTTDFDSVTPGSIPGRGANLLLDLLGVAML